MILVDTSVWIDHFRRGIPALEHALSQGAVVIHPFVTGELACGMLKDRDRTLTGLSDLPQVIPAADDEVLALIERQRLFGRGGQHCLPHEQQCRDSQQSYSRRSRLEPLVRNNTN